MYEGLYCNCASTTFVTYSCFADNVFKFISAPNEDTGHNTDKAGNLHGPVPSVSTAFNPRSAPPILCVGQPVSHYDPEQRHGAQFTRLRWRPAGLSHSAWAILSGGDPYCRYEVFKLHIADFLLRAYCKAPKNAFVGANRSISLQIGAFIGYPVERLAVG